MTSIPRILAIVCTLSSLAITADARQVTGIAAKVNGSVITINEVNYHLTPYRQQLDAAMPRN